MRQEIPEWMTESEWAALQEAAAEGTQEKVRFEIARRTREVNTAVGMGGSIKSLSGGGLRLNRGVRLYKGGVQKTVIAATELDRRP